MKAKSLMQEVNTKTSANSSWGRVAEYPHLSLVLLEDCFLGEMAHGIDLKITGSWKGRLLSWRDARPATPYSLCGGLSGKACWNLNIWTLVYHFFAYTGISMLLLGSNTPLLPLSSFPWPDPRGWVRELKTTKHQNQEESCCSMFQEVYCAGKLVLGHSEYWHFRRQQVFFFKKAWV